ncbi:stage II sporulation protein B [Fontibacillus phaseoli]|uniref:Stage II sporulation protein B n=1 Tax=Fontibacillus phaseoli TaxID=1416533 RepID=A0A369BE76_9BACL|nr:SPOR domain-containing protein [Fontibacillus phaseoli]RCX19862.1 stage II sporulation protein B [Fontibacillus phaseoli]
MNKAKMTFRFDDQGRQTPDHRQTPQEEQAQQEWQTPQEERVRHKWQALQEGQTPPNRQGPQGGQTPPERTLYAVPAPERRAAEIPLDDPVVGHVHNDRGKSNVATTKGIAMESDLYREEHGEPIPPGQSYRPVEMTDDWGDPFTDYTGTGGTILPSYTAVREHRTSWWKVAGSLTGAIVTGALFGFVVLSMFNGEVTVPIPGISVPNQTSAGESVTDVPVLGPIIGLDDTESSAGMKVNIALPPQSYYFLQYGVFSTAEGVELAQKELQNSGIAAARDTIDEKRVYAGVSSDREQAKLLSSQLKTAGVHLILHELSLPSSAEIVFDGDVTLLERYFAESAELVGLLGSLSASRLVEATPQALAIEEIEDLRQKHQSWTESAAIVRGKQPEEFASGAGEMEKAMNSAVEAMAEYNKKQVKTLLWEVQDEVMSFILAEQKMVGTGG